MTQMCAGSIGLTRVITTPIIAQKPRQTISVRKAGRQEWPWKTIIPICDTDDFEILILNIGVY